ncbi:MAG TPA: hypothetical protein VG779_02550 [Actinomycetota bacterium]|jgi:hypothetical protein|nr:hypothetical protein [Actinomycetota bacterium]
MTRRASLPGVDELFRSQKEKPEEPQVAEAPSLQVAKDPELKAEPEPDPAGGTLGDVRMFDELNRRPQPQEPPVPVLLPAVAALPADDDDPPAEADGARRPRHDEKVTFYCTASDLTRIERARLALRAEHKLASDRGRIVRAALAEILDDFESNGSSSALVRRLRRDRPS